jgi:hypothetical protein
MGETTIEIAAAPEHVYDHLTRMNNPEGTTLKVGSQFVIPGKSEIFTVYMADRPNRYGFSVRSGEVTSRAEYTILPQGDGSLVRVEMDQDSPSLLGAVIYGALMEGRAERGILEDLKTAVETKGNSPP